MSQLAPERKIRTAVLFIASFLLLTIVLGAQSGTRMVVGRVVDARGNTLRGAVVQLEDTQTLVVRSYITQGDGVYHFSGLSGDVDYELRAQYRDHWSDRKMVNKFDSSPKPHIDLTIPID